MKYQVTESEYTDLSEDVQKLYGSEKDGNHIFKIDGMPDFDGQKTRITAMDAKIDDLLTETKNAKTKARDAEKELLKANKKKAKEDGDTDALELSWQTKYDTDLGTANTERDDALKMLRLEKVHSRAVELATTLAVPGSADVLLPHIESRLSMTIKDGRAVVEVKDKAGQPSALTVDELGKEIANSEAFAPLIVASNAAGGGANGTQRGGAAKSKTINKSQWDGMNPSQKMEFSVGGGQVTET